MNMNELIKECVSDMECVRQSYMSEYNNSDYGEEKFLEDVEEHISYWLDDKNIKLNEIDEWDFISKVVGEF